MKITVKDVIEYFEQDFTTASAWDFSDPLEAAAVVRAQQEQLDKWRKGYSTITRSYYLEEIERLKRERDEAYERSAQMCEERGRKIGGAIQPDRTAKAVRDLKAKP